MNQLEISFGSPLRIVVSNEPSETPSIISILTIWYESFKIVCKGDVMYNLPVDHTVRMQVTYQDAEGNPAAVDSVSWASSDKAIATVAEDTGDPTIVVVNPIGPIGQVQITATADVDLGQGVKNLLTTSDITIVAGEAVSGTIAPVGPPDPKA
jgi:hypothetical protein